LGKLHYKNLKIKEKSYANRSPPPSQINRINELSANHLEDQVKVPIVGFATNKWDSIGKEHNECVRYVLTRISKLGGTCDLLSLANEFASSRGKLQELLDLNLTLPDIANGLNNAFPGGELSLAYFTGISGVPANEESYLLNYLNTILNVKTTIGIIAFSKIQESIVVSDSSLSSTSQARLLRMMSISRYSASFWHSIRFEPNSQESSNFINLYGCMLDALVEYICIQEGYLDCAGSCAIVACMFSTMCLIGIY
jgi:hypothetical protein